jgi:hypothetical protein
MINLPVGFQWITLRKCDFMKKTRLKKKIEFSKVLLIQESILIWIMTISFIILAFVCIYKEYLGELPWLSAMVALPWTA